MTYILIIVSSNLQIGKFSHCQVFHFWPNCEGKIYWFEGLIPLRSGLTFFVCVQSYVSTIVYIQRDTRHNSIQCMCLQAGNADVILHKCCLDLYSYHEPFQNRDFTKWEWIHSRHYMGFLSLVSLGNLLEYGPIRTMRVSTRPDRLIKQTNTQSVSICRHNESLNVWNKHVWIDGHCHILLPY